jgi:hypothetical protein
MASITLDSTALPGGYVFVGETFLDAERAATGDLTADDLSGAGFTSQYISVYENPDNGSRITSYVSDWGGADAAEAGFEIIEDEGRTHPDGELSDAEAGVGESPGETTTGTYPDPENADVTISAVDTTFRVDRFLVGTSLETTDGSEPDAEIVKTMAGTLEGRATAAVGNQNPEGTDLALQAQALPLAEIGPELQAGFLTASEVEAMYGLQGSSLGQMTASWSEAAAVGDDIENGPFVGAGLTAFGKEEDAAAIVSQAPEMLPDTLGAEPIDGVEIEGADSVAAFQYVSPATGASEADSVRIVSAVGSHVLVVDVQGARDVATAQEAATALATAQAGCVGADSCKSPALPDGLVE